jgi:putative flippase GtrA
VRLDRFVPPRLRKLAPEALKFALVGGANTIVNFVVLNALILTILPKGELKAKVIATIVAAVTSYFMNRHWTYRDRPKSAVHREVLLFIAFNGAGLAIELAVMGVTKYWFGLTSLLATNAAAFVGMVLGTIFRFFTYRSFVFSPAPKVSPAGADMDLGPAHLHFENTAELLDAEALASTLAGVPVAASVPPTTRPRSGHDGFEELTAGLEAEFATDEDMSALHAPTSAARSRRQGRKAA